jgi:hypothetical protein
MLRHISYFEDLRRMAVSAGLAATHFQPFRPEPADAEDLALIPLDTVVARVYDRTGTPLEITAGALCGDIAATVPAYAQHRARWLALSHLRGLTKPEYPSQGRLCAIRSRLVDIGAKWHR